MLHIWKVESYSQKLLAEKGKRGEGNRNTARVGKRKWRTVSS